mmetsp:Transcript_63485/g.112911  ORF Transcript_63485/g.112911 Transcript_63485/m.112911 type:complete len:1002 (+) Transcript_63485:113-3118(+)|eukprot:CAMPEP_0197623094 /NCGR_PEP_ID=MMETSP1338-20131121/3168_1 /TAXON_ID=43686 ORGANISM="Pelagodinium beii, Strain RCC1491" /NCGR_SAMPLE_ID=MMETSP1338 /ASSEMBLY_ACC=CAM_ASM_000754 /LENGTH=1001 /DNA_ID=CAMNT_0043192951 /DNA_START=91 /DNA_END=3096 /DNA_ORIENTATION=-
MASGNVLNIREAGLSNDDLARLQPRPTKLPSNTKSTALGQLPPAPAIQVGQHVAMNSPGARQIAMVAPAEGASMAYAPPRLVARLKELELDSLLSLCERLEGRLHYSSPKKRSVASPEELSELAEDLSSAKALAPQLRQHIQNRQSVQSAREFQALQVAPVTRVALPPPVQTQTEAAPTAAALDNLLAELNGLLQVASSNSLPAGPMTVSLPHSTVGAGRLPAVAMDTGVAEGLPSVAEEWMEPAQVPLETKHSSFTEALLHLQTELANLATLHDQEVASVSKGHESLLREVEILRQRCSEKAAGKPDITLPGQVDQPSASIEAESQTDVPVEEAATSMTPFPLTKQKSTAPEVRSPGGKKHTPRSLRSSPKHSPRARIAASASRARSEGNEIELCDAWQQELPEGQAEWGEDMDEFAKSQDKAKPAWLMHELSQGRMALDLLGLLLILYDVVATPYSVAFGIDALQTEVMAWVLPVFWSMDIFVTLAFTTFSAGGAWKPGRKKMAWRYARKGWLPLDLVTTGVDILLLTFLYNLSNATYTSIQSVIKGQEVYLILQCIRLLRTLRVKRNLACIWPRVGSELLRAVASVALPVIAVLIGAHIAACGLVYVSVAAYTSTSNSWLQDYQQASGLDDPSQVYLTTFLWAMSHVTPGLGGGSPVNPKSVPEMVFGAVVHVFGMLALLFLLAQTGGMVLRLQQLWGELPRRQMLLRSYLQQGPKVDGDLNLRIWSWMELEMDSRAQPDQAWQGRLCARQAALGNSAAYKKDGGEAPLNILPPQLKQELLGELCTPVMTLHPFFHELDVAHPQALPQVIECLAQVYLDPGQELFAAGQEAKQMLFLAKGQCLYIRASGRSKAGTRTGEARVQVSSNQHVSEAALWLQNWSHQGELVADGFQRCEAWALDSTSFAIMMRKAPCELFQAAASYAAAFARRAGAEDFNLIDVDLDIETLLKLTDEAFADALKFLAQEAFIAGHQDAAVDAEEVDVEAGKEADFSPPAAAE